MSGSHPRVRRRLRERGHAILETALVFVPFLTLVGGIMEFSRLTLIRNSITYAATQGARYAIVRGYNAASPATTTSVATYVRTQSLGVSNPSAITVTTTWPDGDNKPGHRVRVQVGYNFQPVAALALKTAIPVSATSVMLIRQ